jgi:hypothetical protein
MLLSLGGHCSLVVCCLVLLLFCFLRFDGPVVVVSARLGHDDDVVIAPSSSVREDMIRLQVLGGSTG